MPNTPKPNNLTQKTLDVIEFMCSRSRSVSLNEIAKGVDLPAATAHRILATLKENGYLDQRSNKDYFMTYKLYVLAGQMMENNTYVDRLLPFMNYCVLNLNQSSGVSLTAFCDDACVNLVSAGRELKFRTEMVVPGAAHDCHCTAAGKLFLSCLSEEELDAWLSRNILLPYTRFTVTDPDRLREDLKKIREQGYGTIDSEFADNLAVISIPIHEENGQIDLAINFSIESSRFDEINNIEFVQEVQELLKKYNIF